MSKPGTDEYPRSGTPGVDEQFVLNDPDAVTLARGVGKHECLATLNLNADRIAHFKRRVVEREMTSDQVVIVVAKVDDVNGGPIADVLVPRYNWQEIRDRGEIPFARGLARRAGIQELLNAFDHEAGAKLRGMTDVAVVVIDHGVAEVFVA